eukprot:7623579-Pyramimonas_sp.AAC.1
MQKLRIDWLPRPSWRRSSRRSTWSSWSRSCAWLWQKLSRSWSSRNVSGKVEQSQEPFPSRVRSAAWWTRARGWPSWWRPRSKEWVSVKQVLPSRSFSRRWSTTSPRSKRSLLSLPQPLLVPVSYTHLTLPTILL